jgi:hypothetical protein
MFEHHAWPAVIFAARGLHAKSSFRVLFRPSQRVVQKRAEVGLDDVELALRYRDGLGKVVDDVGAVAHDPRRANRPRQPGIQTTSGLNLGTPKAAGDRRSSYAQLGPGSIARIRFPPHVQAKLP